MSKLSVLSLYRLRLSPYSEYEEKTRRSLSYLGIKTGKRGETASLALYKGEKNPPTPIKHYSAVCYFISHLFNNELWFSAGHVLDMS